MTDADRIRRVRAELAELAERAESPDGMVEVSVGAQGQLRSLWLDPRIYRNRDAAALAADIVEAVRVAAESAGARARDVAAPVLASGASDPFFGPAFAELDRLIRQEG
ncbi:hypothetical protein GCM10022222_80200 [Amycolatopsis ultiminotia]|uniref:YbaB/EbfC DNA-binding family protein n=1 Tax=Amycolatopsis ultiminotia TaxID=543629 RepID=A0ABP6YGU1_9PSEU